MDWNGYDRFCGIACRVGIEAKVDGTMVKLGKRVASSCVAGGRDA